MCMRMHREFLNFGNNVFVDSSKPLAHTYPKKICYKEPCTIRTLFSWLATRYNLWVKFKLQCIWLSVKKCSCILIQKKSPYKRLHFEALKMSGARRAHPDRTFQIFRASKLGDTKTLCSLETSLDGFWSSKFVKCLVGALEGNRELGW